MRSVRILVLALAALWASTGFAQEPVTVPGLLQQFKAMPGLYARFHEEKNIALLETPLLSEGTIHFAPPSRLARHTRRPTVSSLIIDGDRLVMGDARTAQQLDLASNPVARTFVDSFRSLLAGDRAALERSFRMSVSGTSADWTLRLVPKSAPLSKLIREMVVHGREIVVDALTVSEHNGDRTRMTFSQVDTGRRYRENEIPRVFRLPSR